MRIKEHVYSGLPMLLDPKQQSHLYMEKGQYKIGDLVKHVHKDSWLLNEVVDIKPYIHPLITPTDEMVFFGPPLAYTIDIKEAA